MTLHKRRCSSGRIRHRSRGALPGAVLQEPRRGWCAHADTREPRTGSSYGPGWRQHARQPQHGRAAGEKRRGSGLTFPCCERDTYGTGSRAWLCRTIWAIGPAISARQSTRETRLAPAAAQKENRSVPPQPLQARRSPRGRLTRCVLATASQWANSRASPSWSSSLSPPSPSAAAGSSPSRSRSSSVIRAIASAGSGTGPPRGGTARPPRRRAPPGAPADRVAAVPRQAAPTAPVFPPPPRPPQAEPRSLLGSVLFNKIKYSDHPAGDRRPGGMGHSRRCPGPGTAPPPRGGDSTWRACV